MITIPVQHNRVPRCDIIILIWWSW